MLRYSYFLVIILVLAKSCGGEQRTKRPAKDFNKHRIIQLVFHNERTRRAISTTRSTDGGHHSSVTLSVTADAEELVLELELNKDLVPVDHTLQYQDGGRIINYKPKKELELNKDLVPVDHTLQYQDGGRIVNYKPKKEDLDLCHYHGSVRGKSNSWAAVSTCHGVSGVIFDGTKMWHVEPTEDGNKHFLYEDSDYNATRLCGQHRVFNGSQLVSELTRRGRYIRDIQNTKVQEPFNSNELSRYVELVLVADSMLFHQKNRNINVVHSDFIKIANIMNAMYTPLNIYIALVGVVVWNTRDLINVNKDSNETLQTFIDYRAKSADLMQNDNAQLLSGLKFDGGVIGKANVGSMCTNEASGAVAYYDSSDTAGVVAVTLAHEMGHNFGMSHDEDNCDCPDKKCIMNASSTSIVPVRWSSCSLDSLLAEFAKGMDYCLRNKPKTLFKSPTCGNGFVEPGEQCDCGVKLDGEINLCHACCHPDTCMLRSNATCGAGACCDLKTCLRKSTGTLCRETDRKCDLPEYCTGDSELCPDDIYKMDTTPCGKGDDQAYCVSGSCRSHTDQCRVLWGPSGRNSNASCYMRYNIQGSEHGHCGYHYNDRSRYKACLQENALCGLLHCWHLNDGLEFGMESFAVREDTYFTINGDEMIHCKTVMVDLGLNTVDPGLVPDGAKCGHEKMCLNQKCVSVEKERDKIAKMEFSICPSNCSGHGVCNSKGHCHCAAGFAPPLCDLPGAGGSVDSGPASDPTVSRNFMIALYVIFLGIVPCILLALFLMHYFFPEKIAYMCRIKCVKALACCHKLNFKSAPTYTSDNSRQSKLTKLRNSITLKGKRVNGINKIVEVDDDPVYENVTNTMPNVQNNTTIQSTVSGIAKVDDINDSSIFENVVNINSFNATKMKDCSTSSSKRFIGENLEESNNKSIYEDTGTSAISVKAVNSTETNKKSNLSMLSELKNPKALRKINKNDNVKEPGNDTIKPVMSYATATSKLKSEKSHANVKPNAASNKFVVPNNLKPHKPNKSEINEATNSGALLPFQSVKLKQQNQPIRKFNKDDIHIATSACADFIEMYAKVIPKKVHEELDDNITKPSFISEVKLKQVNSKPGSVKGKPVIENKRLASSTNAMLNKGRLYNVGDRNAS